MNFPTNVKYTNEHEWIRLEGDEAYVGITDYAQEQLGDIVFVDVTTEGETLEKGEVFGTIEVVKTVSDLFLPIGGEVLEINPELEEHPELVKAFLTAQKQVLDKMDADHAAAVAATAKATGLEEAAVEAEEPPQAVRTPVAPTTAEAFRKSRREIIFIIVFSFIRIIAISQAHLLHAPGFPACIITACEEVCKRTSPQESEISFVLFQQKEFSKDKIISVTSTIFHKRATSG